MKVPLGQTPNRQNGNQPSSSRQQETGQGSQPSSSRQQATGQASQPSGGRQQETGQGSQPSRNGQHAQVAATDEPSREKIYLSKESMAMVKEAVALGRLLPPDASRDELRAYNKLAGELTKQTRQWRQAMEKQEKEELERQNSHRQPPRSGSPTRNRSKINNL